MPARTFRRIPSVTFGVASCLAACYMFTSYLDGGTYTNNRALLTVHEWGTWTELQDFDGTSVADINTDDEPVPGFVHHLGVNLLDSTREHWARNQHSRRPFSLQKSLPHLENITMRLETPVIYFYPPKGATKPLRVDVDVQLRGGWLSEFYPNAESNAPGLRRRHLGRHAAGTLRWPRLKIEPTAGSSQDSRIPQTDEHVWTAPRETNASIVTTPKGESEKYLFYRGVGNIRGPLRVVTDFDNDRLSLISKFHTLDAAHDLVVPAAWLVSVKADGEVAFRSIGELPAPNDVEKEIGQVRRSFSAADYSQGNLEQLKQQMHAELVSDGLFPDEATAMLATWDDAYFRSTGLRLFYLLPVEWTEDRMPLTLSVASDITRVMMGRIELIDDRQRELLDEIAAETQPDKSWTASLPKNEATARFWKGDNNLDELRRNGCKVPKSYQAYMQLGRFRNAMLRHRAVLQAEPNLVKFLQISGVSTARVKNATVSKQPIREQTAQAK